MGKCMKKSKITAEVSLVEVVSPRSSSALMGGVRTRAKSLALRRLLGTAPDPNSSSSSSCYLELRSRRLHKPPQPPIRPRNQLPRPRQGSRASSNFRRSSPDDARDGSSLVSSRLAVDSGSAASVSMSCEEMQSRCEGHFGRIARGSSEDSDRRENNSESDEQNERQASSSTMLGLVQGGNDVVPGIPTADEMEEFFAFAEQEQRRLFIEKYALGCIFL
ncbi:hypothetical protein CDL15_Pgr005287 [Punica granatum]|uniref:Cyclin-dependent kinase inhibitor n=1 Tax=Punica granatum TaxID=22663 RepID=A0A218XD63_PUNGR|nr:hypothetical protein CDL15_Pgr005287 [Punica granatum]